MRDETGTSAFFCRGTSSNMSLSLMILGTYFDELHHYLIKLKAAVETRHRKQLLESTKQQNKKISMIIFIIIVRSRLSR